jgi:hypothetical protein
MLSTAEAKKRFKTVPLAHHAKEADPKSTHYFFLASTLVLTHAGLMDAEPFDSDALESRRVTNERELNRIRNMPHHVSEHHATEAERLEADQDAIESRLGFDSRSHATSNCASYLSHGHRIYVPSPEEIEALKRQIRAENEAKESLEGSPSCLMSYRPPRVGRTEYSQGRIRN